MTTRRSRSRVARAASAPSGRARLFLVALFFGPPSIAGCSGSDSPANPTNSPGQNPRADADGSEGGATPSPADAATQPPTDIDPETGKKLVPVVVAQGLMGRTAISCDDGKTWKAERSFDVEGNDLVCGDKTPVVCQVSACRKRMSNGSCGYQAECDCMHGPGYGQGVVIAQNQILANFGHGDAGAILRSVDGESWRSVLDLPQALYPNIVYGAGRFVFYSGFEPYVSDDGRAWRKTTATYPREGGRATTFLDAIGGRFIAAQEGVVRVSSDRGETWPMARSAPADCTSGIAQAQTIVTGNGVAVMVSWENRTACRSADGGQTWTVHRITNDTGGVFFQNPVFVGGKFTTWAMLYDNPNNKGTRFTSSDGVTWEATQTNGPIWMGPAGVTTQGTLVATTGASYAAQTFLRSTDGGLTWSALPATAVSKGHYISRFAAGLIPANAVCPAKP